MVTVISTGRLATGPPSARRAVTRGLHLVAGAVAGAVEVELLVEARLLVLVDEELARDGREAVRLLADGQRVLAAGRLGVERDLAGADAVDRLAVRAVDDGVGRLSSSAPACGRARRSDGAERAGERVVQAEVLAGRLEGEAVERQRAEADDLAGLVHRLVGRQVREVDRRRQLHLPDQADLLAGDAGLLFHPACAVAGRGFRRGLVGLLAGCFLRAVTSMLSDWPGCMRNRTPPKTQSALLEAMQEYQVTVGGVRHALERPLFVLATENPIEQEGTYPLPEAQLDRFMLNVVIDYPSADEERAILAQTTTADEPRVAAVATGEQIERARLLVREIPAAANVVDYAARLIRSSRPVAPAGERVPDFVRDWVRWGAGPRAGQALLLAGKARAVLQGRPAVSIEDVRAVARPVLRHRLLVNFQAEAEGIDAETLVSRLLETIRS